MEASILNSDIRICVRIRDTQYFNIHICNTEISRKVFRDLNTPIWVQHIAFQVHNESALKKAKAELVKKGLDVLGVTEHGIIKSIYFFDPNGHRIELTCAVGTAKEMKQLKKIAPEMPGVGV